MLDGLELQFNLFLIDNESCDNMIVLIHWLS